MNIIYFFLFVVDCMSIIHSNITESPIFVKNYSQKFYLQLIKKIILFF
jgi:hypothetical protein